MSATPVASAGGDARNDVAAGLRVELQLDQLAVARFLEEGAEALEAVIALVEPGLAALQGLLDHRSPDFLFLVALGEEILGSLHHELAPFLAAVVRAGLRRRCCLRHLLLARALRAPLAAHEVVVVDEFVAAA